MKSGFIPPQFLTPTELAEFLKISRTTVYRMVEKRLFPSYKINGSLRFRMDDVLVYVKKCRIQSAHELYEYN
jgi:excisionase family DNA binding protein